VQRFAATLIESDLWRDEDGDGAAVGALEGLVIHVADDNAIGAHSGGFLPQVDEDVGIRLRSSHAMVGGGGDGADDPGVGGHGMVDGHGIGFDGGAEFAGDFVGAGGAAGGEDEEQQENHGMAGQGGRGK